MINTSTKQKIRNVALDLFSTQGYNSTTVEDISKEVGIKAPSLYKHYESKQAIFDTLIDEARNGYTQQMASIQISGHNASKDSNFFESITEGDLLQIGNALFSFFIHDEFTQKIRKIFKIEQFRDKALNSLYIEQYFDNPLSFHEQLFLNLINLGAFIENNSRVVALHFYAPIHYLIELCDAQPDREKEAFDLLERHIKQFKQLYEKKDQQ